MGYVKQRLSREIEPGGNERGKGGGGGGRSFKRNNKCGRVQRRKNKKKTHGLESASSVILTE